MLHIHLVAAYTPGGRHAPNMPPRTPITPTTIGWGLWFRTTCASPQQSLVFPTTTTVHRLLENLNPEAAVAAQALALHADAQRDDVERMARAGVPAGFRVSVEG